MKIDIYQVDAHRCKVKKDTSQALVAKAIGWHDERTQQFKTLLNRTQHGGFFLCGSVPFVKERLETWGHSVHYHRILFKRLKYKLTDYTMKGIKLEKYQLKMIAPVGPTNRGILVSATGSGKTVVMGSIIKRFDIPETLIITPTRDIFDQTINEFSKWFKTSIGQIGKGTYTIGHITVALFQSLSKLTTGNLKEGDFKLLIVDEAHKVNKTILKICKKLPNTHYRYGLTATPQRYDYNFEKAYEQFGCLGPVLVDIPERETIKRVLPVEVNMLRYVCARPQGTDYQSVLHEDVLFSEKRNLMLLKTAMKLAISKGLTCLILLDEVKQGEWMVEDARTIGIEPLFAHGSNKIGVNQKIKDLLNRRKTKLVIATKVFSTGTDIPNVDCIVLASSNKSYIDTIQKIGRGRRRTSRTTKLIVIDCVDIVIGNRNFHRTFYHRSIERINTYKEMNWNVKKTIC